MSRPGHVDECIVVIMLVYLIPNTKRPCIVAVGYHQIAFTNTPMRDHLALSDPEDMSVTKTLYIQALKGTAFSSLWRQLRLNYLHTTRYGDASHIDKDRVQV